MAFYRVAREELERFGAWDGDDPDSSSGLASTHSS